MGNDFELVSAIVLFVLAVIGTVLYAWRVRRAPFTEPIYQFLFFYSLFVLPLPIRVCITKQVEGDITQHLPLLVPYMPWAVILCALGLPLFAWGYYGNAARIVATYVPRPVTGKHSRAAFLCLTLLALLLLTLLSRDAGSLLDFILLGYGATSEMIGRGYLAIGFPWLWVGAFFLLYRYAIHKHKLDLILFSIAMILNLLISVVMGQRSTIIYFVLAFGLFWHHAVRAIPFKKLAILGVAVFVCLNLVGAYRGAKFESILDIWTRTSDSFSARSGSWDFYSYTLTTGEFVVPFEALPEMIRSVGDSVNYQFGASYLRAPLFFIPSALYPNRPLPLSNWYVQQFYGGGVGLNEGRQFFFLAEGYLNFGVLGVLLTMFGWGAFLGTCRHYLKANGRNPGAVLLYAFTVAFIIRGISGDFVSLLVGVPEQILSAAVLGLWIVRWRQPRLSRRAAKLSMA